MQGVGLSAAAQSGGGDARWAVMGCGAVGEPL